MRAFVSFLVLLSAWGCPRAIRTQLDAAAGDAAAIEDAGAGDAGDAPRDFGVAEDAGVARDLGLHDAEVAEDAGAPDGAAPDTGTADADARRPITFRTLPYPSSGPTVNAVSVSPGGELWVGNANGVLYRFDGRNFVEAWREPNNFAIHRLAVTARHVYVGGESTFYVHGPIPDANPARLSTGGTINGLHLVSDDEIYLAVDRLDRHALLQYDGQGLVELHVGSESASFASVYKDEENVVWVGAIGGLFSLRDASFGAEPLEWPASFSSSLRTTFTFEAVGGAGGRVFAGGDGHAMFEWDGQSWRTHLLPQPFDGGAKLRGIASSTTEAYAVGNAGGAGAVLWFDGERWAETEQGEDWSLWDLTEHDGAFWAGGAIRNSFDGIVVVGRRQ